MRNESPSYQTGFAPRDGEPPYPELWTGCVGAWSPGLGPSGTVLHDWSGRANHGTLNNGPTWGIIGGRQAINYDGVDDDVRFTGITLGDFTMSIWATSSSFAANRILLGAKTNGHPFMGFLGASSTVYYRSANAATSSLRSFAIANAPIAGRMFHLMLTRKAGNIKCFVDGIQSSTVVTGDTDDFYCEVLGSYSTASLGWLGGIHDAVISSLAMPELVSVFAKRPGIAYELSPIRRAGESASAYRRRIQQAQMIGGGMI